VFERLGKSTLRGAPYVDIITPGSGLLGGISVVVVLVKRGIDILSHSVSDILRRIR
jgi:hypothetical protein